MHRFRILTLLILVGFTFEPWSASQTVEALDHSWHQTFDALKAGNSNAASESFADFNTELRLYWAKPEHRDWRSRYLAGSLYCQFPRSRDAGAALLRGLLQDGRDLSDTGKAELRRLLTACNAQTSSSGEVAPHDLPADMIDASAHYQTAGVHSFTKAGVISTGNEMSGAAVSPIPATELLSRRVSLSDPPRALSAALARLPGSTGAIVEQFAVTTTGSASVANQIGNCLVSNAKKMREQFEIGPPEYMVTVYMAENNEQVYDYARRLHGLELPRGVLAYSVAEDMSLAGSDCGSMAHELVHLLIKPKFPVSPAWLEEGLASEVAVASPQDSKFKFRSSWRDRTLKENWGERPTVATLLTLSWSDFIAANQGDLRRSAAVQAMAAVFIRYLSEKGKLEAIYFEVRDHSFSADPQDFRTYKQIIENKFGKSADEIDTDFVKWFNSGNSMPSNSAANSTSGNTSTGPCKPLRPMEQTAQDNCVPAEPNKKSP